MFEFTSLLVSLALTSLLGAGPQISAPETNDPCHELQTEDTCLRSDACDMFETREGDTCALACDERVGESSCMADGMCAWSGAVCGYPQTMPGC